MTQLGLLLKDLLLQKLTYFKGVDFVGDFGLLKSSFH